MLFVPDYRFSTLGSLYEFCIKNKSVYAVYAAWGGLPDTKAWKLDSQVKFIPRYFLRINGKMPSKHKQ